MQTTIIQLANHYTDLKLGITSEPLGKHKRNQLKKIRKLEAEPERYPDHGLADYAIPLETVPDNLIVLMQALGWLSEYTKMPINSNGFCWESWRPDNTVPVGTVLTKYFIAFDKYVELLSIERKLQNGGSHE